MTDIKAAPEPKSVAAQLHEVEQLLTEWTFLAGWATPEAEAAFKRCQGDVRRALGLDVFGRPQ